MTTMSRSWIKTSIQLGFIIRLLIFSKTCSSSSLNEINNINLLRMESDMILKLHDYATREKNRLNQLKLHLQDWKEWRNYNTDQEAEYITIPQNIFHLFKRLTLDLGEIQKFILEKSYNNTMILYDIEPPTDHHLRQVILSLVGLQYQYDLKAEDIMSGSLMGVPSNASLNLDVCYFIGKTCSEYNNHRCVADWLKICLFLSSNTDPPAAAIASKITRLLCPSYIFLNKTEFAYGCALNYLIEYDYFDAAFMRIAIEKGSEYGQLTSNLEEFVEGYRICREHHENPTKPNLKCRYNHENSAFLKIAPLKEEELYDAPKILYYRDVLYDSEIKFIKTTSIEKMKTALLHGRSNPAFTQRVTETAFINTHLPPLIALEKRAEDIFGWSIYLSESWQVLNYAPGGFYNTHNDYLPFDEKYARVFGNRITTMLFYMNDVILGGETVFPRIGLSVKPTKGSAVVWYNMHADGSENQWTDHSACPVVIGEKWGFTKWVRFLKKPQCLRSIYESDLKISKSRSNAK